MTLPSSKIRPGLIFFPLWAASLPEQNRHAGTAGDSDGMADETQRA